MSSSAASPPLLKSRRRGSEGLPGSMVGSTSLRSGGVEEDDPDGLRFEENADGVEIHHEKKKKHKKKKHKKKRKNSLVRAISQTMTGTSNTNNNHQEPPAPVTTTTSSLTPPEREPSGFVKRFTSLGQSTRPKQDVEDVQMEESELFDDTFTFLMVGTYPGESCCGCRQPPSKAEKSTIDEEQELMDHSTGTFLSDSEKHFENVDPDAWYLPFWTGTFVICSQLFIYFVVVANVFLQDTIPPNADRWLRLAQIFAVLVTLYTQTDFIDGVFLITERWKAFEEVTTPCKFNLSAILRVFAGNVGILATFVLVMYSDEVVDLLLNFTAMEFVATLDGSAFELASKGFLGNTLEKKCLEIQEFRYVRRFRKGAWTRIAVYGFYVLLVFGAFLTIVALQAAREVGVDNEVYVQFDDTEVAELFGISGVYHGCKTERTKKTGGITYVGISLPCPERRGEKNRVFQERSFVYCWKLDGWVYLEEETTTPCQTGSFLMRSFLDDGAADSNSFDLLTSSKANWLVSRTDELGGEALLSSFFIDSVKSFEDTFFYCDEGSGLIRTDLETTKQRKFEPLPEESLYFPSFEGTNYRDVFGLSYRPIYRRAILTQKDKYQVVIFNGLRWEWLKLNPRAFAQNISREDDCEDEDPDCWKVFVQHYRSSSAWRSNFTVVLTEAISDPMIYLTPGDTGIPTGDLVWYESRLVDGRVLPGKRYQEANENSGGEDVALGFECAATLQLECPEGHKMFVVDLTTDFFPEETTIIAFFGQGLNEMEDLRVAKVQIAPTRHTFVLPPNGLIELGFQEPTVSYLLGTCIPRSESCIQVVVTDFFGDGIEAPGEYDFSYDGGPSIGSEGNDFFSCRSYAIGDGCKGGTSQPVACNLTELEEKYPDVVEGLDELEEPEFIFQDDDFQIDPDLVTQNPTFGGSEGGSGFSTMVPTFELFCDAREVELTFQVTTDQFPDETAIVMFSGQSVQDLGGFTTVNEITAFTATGNFILSDTVATGLFFNDGPRAYVAGTCIPSTISCLQVIIVDNAEDGIFLPGGYEITFNGGTTQVVSDGTGFECRSYQFGSGCLNLNQMPDDCSPVESILELYPPNVVESGF